MSVKKKKKRTREHQCKRQVGVSKPRVRDVASHHVLRGLLHPPCCRMLKFIQLRKNRKIQGKEFMQRLGLAQEVLESQVTGGWENIVLKYYCILALPIQFCLCICQCSFLPLPSPVPRGTTLVGPS